MKMQAWTTLGLMTIFVLIYTFSGFAALEEVPGYEFRAFTEINVKAFLTQLKAEKVDLEKDLKKKYADKPEKVAKDARLATYFTIIKGVESLQGKSKSGLSEDTLDREFLKLQRLHYGLLADLGEAEKESALKRGFRIAKGYGFGPLILNVPNVIDPKAGLGSRLAKHEAKRLYRPGGKAPVSLDEIENMSAFEVSRLQPPPNHNAIIDGPPGSRYAAFLNETTRLIRMQSPELAKFDFTYARRVLFYDELKADATSPKVTAKDRFGLKWKVKWGDEVHTDVAMTRIYIDLGGTYTDTKFYSGPGETILVLDPPSENKAGAIKDFTQLADELLASKFQFHAHRYLLPKPQLKDKTGRILGSGVVDRQMAERESIPAKYIGANYVLFKESQLSLFNPAIRRLGGASLSNVGAPDDRVARSSMIFNCWAKNKDMKDDNSRVGLLFNPQTKDFDRMVEFQSDIGCSLGSRQSQGELNSFEDSFVMLMPMSINFILRPLYVPKAWKECTWADARWMALRIAALSRADLERSLSESGWPAFAQKIAVEKLISRRNELVRTFKLDADGVKEIPCDTRFSEKAHGKSGTDYPVKNGKINGDSAAVKSLEESVHPEGLVKVISRGND